MPEALYKSKTSDYTQPMPRTEPFNLRLDPELMGSMSIHAKREGRSRNNLIEHIMRAYDADERIRDLVRQYVDPVPASD